VGGCVAIRQLASDRGLGYPRGSPGDITGSAAVGRAKVGRAPVWSVPEDITEEGHK
jgi:hypothetical protein